MRMTRHYPYEEIADALTRHDQILINLEAGDTAWNPASTKNLISGPCDVTFIRWRDGGYEARIES